MRTIRTMMALAGALTLTVASVGAGVGQEPPAAAAFTGWALDETHISSAETVEADDRLQRRDLAYAYDFVTSDPRMTGRAIWTGNGDRFRAEPLFEVQSSHWSITNDEGGWEGSGPGIRGSGLGDVSSMLLEGTGAYAGLSAIIFAEWGLGGGNLRGAIFPGDLVGVPDPVDAP